MPCKKCARITRIPGGVKRKNCGGCRLLQMENKRCKKDGSENGGGTVQVQGKEQEQHQQHDWQRQYHQQHHRQHQWQQQQGQKESCHQDQQDEGQGRRQVQRLRGSDSALHACDGNDGGADHLSMEEEPSVSFEVGKAED